MSLLASPEILGRSANELIDSSYDESLNDRESSSEPEGNSGDITTSNNPEKSIGQLRENKAGELDDSSNLTENEEFNRPKANILVTEAKRYAFRAGLQEERKESPLKKRNRIERTESQEIIIGYDGESELRCICLESLVTLQNIYKQIC